MKKFTPSSEQKRIFDFNRKKMVISASAGSGKTTTMIEFICQLIEKGQPVKRLLVMTFTKAAASEMKERLMLRLISQSQNQHVRSQIDDLSTGDICTIHSFLEKLIRRNLSQFPYLEGFRILDEQQAGMLKEEALQEAKRQFKAENKERYLSLLFNLQSEQTLKDIIFSVDDFLCAQADKRAALEKLEDFEAGKNATEKFLKEILTSKIGSLNSAIDLFPRDNSKAEEYLQTIRRFFTLDRNLGLREMCLALAGISLPVQPRLTQYDKKEEVVSIKISAKDIIELAKKLSPSESIVWQSDKNRQICEGALKLYRLFDQAYSALKENGNALDFNDLELKSASLLGDEQILSEIQESFDFVFIDEYQDTSPVQERIVKLISEKGKFVAIGDPKQGIYAFRNATSEIILKDISDFDKQEDAQAEKLSKNYRSDKEILKFVNHVFSQIMTEKTSGIDYRQSSILQGDTDAVKAGQPAVQVLVAPKAIRAIAPICEDYDIFSDTLESEESASCEAEIVAAKIDEFLASEFVDPKTGEKRRVLPSDIAILSRSKSGLCDSVMNELLKREIPFVSTLSTDLTTKAHTQIILNLLSLCVDEFDDIALASYLASPLCSISLQTLAEIAAVGKQSFHEKIFASENAEIKSALKTLHSFKNEALFSGAKRALERLFLEREYFVYLKTRVGENGASETQSVLSSIASFENDKDIAELVCYLKSSLSFSNVSGNSAVTISTIHASKGLEYPIVFVIGTGRPLLRSDASSFKLDRNFGLGLMVLDEEAWQKFPSPILVAAREAFKERERASELMVLYVALTRAKSHLIVTGTIDSEKVQDFSEESFDKSSSYLDLILSTRPEKEFCVQEIEEVVSLKSQSEKIGAWQVNGCSLKEEILKYINFKYPFEKDTTSKQKSSVTELARSGDKPVSLDLSFAEEGTAYHEALKIIDFEKAENIEEIKNQLNNKKFPEKYAKLIDLSLIFENIKLIKPLLENKQIIKEKDFTMRVNSQNSSYLVQGTVDLYLKGDKNILIDYKYTRERDEKTLINRYEKQLLLYKSAIENAENINIDEIYLISLKNKKIIKY